MMSLRKISFPRMAMTAAGVCVLGMVLWFAVGGDFPHRADGAGNNSPAKQPEPTGSPDHSTPPWASEEQKAKAAEREAMRRKKFELYAELTKGLPELQPKLDGIPEFEVNGFERLMALTEAKADVLPNMPDEFQEMLRGKRPWDSVAVQAYLRQHAELLAELAAISRVPSGEIDWQANDSDMSGSAIATMVKVLCMAGLDAAHNRSPSAALDWMEVLHRLSGHLRTPEDSMSIPSLMGLGVQMELQRMAPQVAKLAANDPRTHARLEKMLESHRLSPEDMAHYHRGDIVSVVLGNIIPWMQSNPQSLAPLSAEEAKKVMRLKFEFSVIELETIREAPGFVDLQARLEKLGGLQGGRDSLNAEEQEAFDLLWLDSRQKITFFIRCETHRQLASAAVRLARDDAAPEAILAEIAASEREPRKLHYDPATRTLTSEPFLTETEKISIQVP